MPDQIKYVYQKKLSPGVSIIIHSKLIEELQGIHALGFANKTRLQCPCLRYQVNLR